MSEYIIESVYGAEHWPHKYVYKVTGTACEHVQKADKEFDAHYFLGTNSKGQTHKFSIISLVDTKSSFSKYRILKDGKRISNKLSIQVIWDTLSANLNLKARD